MPALRYEVRGLQTGKKILEIEKRYAKSEAEKRVLVYQKKYAIISVFAVLKKLYNFLVKICNIWVAVGSIEIIAIKKDKQH